MTSLKVLDKKSIFNNPCTEKLMPLLTIKLAAVVVGYTTSFNYDCLSKMLKHIFKNL